MEVLVSTEKKTDKSPSSTTANKVFGASYVVYIDIKPTKNALFGALFKGTINNGFTFDSTCKTDENLCTTDTTATDYDAACKNKLKLTGTTCSVDKGELSFDSGEN